MNKKQKFRLLNTLLAAGGGLVLCCIWVYAFNSQRLAISLGALIGCLVFFWFVSGFIIGLIVTNVNLRFKDPSMTLAQMYWAGITSLISLFVMPELREVLYLLIFLILVFGIFQADVPQFNVFSIFMFIGVMSHNAYLMTLPHSSLEFTDTLFVSAVIAFCMFAISSLCKALVSLKKRLQRQNHELDKALKTKSEFLAVMSHELRTPLNGVMGMVKMVLRKEVDEQVRRRLEIADHSAEELLRLINQILEYSQFDVETKVDESVDLNIRSLMDELLEKIDRKLRAKSLAAELIVAENVPEIIHLDVSLYQRSVSVIIDNAIKFTEKGGIKIQLSFENENEKKKLCTKIEDTGVGIPKGNIANIFSPFTQVDNSSTRKFGGTGMGLAIAKKICTVLGGEINVTSEEGKGSSFTLILPIK